MEMEKMYTETTEPIGIHREILLDNFNSLPGNKWEKENYKFFGEFGSSPCNPCTKNENQLSAYQQDKQDRNLRISKQ
jgi:hypothetical protein